MFSELCIFTVVENDKIALFKWLTGRKEHQWGAQ
jgi:hypothetical protein